MAETSRQFEIVGSFRDNLTPGLRNVQNALSRFTTGGAASMKSLLGSFVSLKNAIVGLGTAFLASKLLTTINAIADRAGKIKDTAQGLGITTEALSELAYAFEQVGGDAEDAGPALSKLSKVIGEIRGGDNAKARSALEGLGIGIDEIVGSKPDELLLRVADAMTKVEDESDAAAAAVEVFGKNGERLVPVLVASGDAIRKARDEARRFGVSLSEEDAKALDDYSDAWKGLKATLEGLFQKLIANVAPAITEKLKEISEWIGANSTDIVLFFHDVTRETIAAAEAMLKLLAPLKEVFGWFEKARQVGASVGNYMRPLFGKERLPDEVLFSDTDAMRRSGTTPLNTSAGARPSGRARSAPTAEGSFLKGFSQQLDEVIAKWKDFAAAGRQAATSIVDGGLNSLVDTLTSISTGMESPKRAFREFAMSAVQSIQRVIWQLLVMRAVAGIGSAFGGGAAPVGSAPQGDFIGPQLAKGGVMHGRMYQLKRYATGGVARGPQLALFGEGKQAEAFVPLPDGRSIPVTMRGGGGGPTVVINVSAIDAAGVAAFFHQNRKQLWAVVGMGAQRDSGLRQGLGAA